MATYTPLQSIVLTSNSTDVIFSNIPQGYTDLVIVSNLLLSAAANVGIQFNGDTTSLYSRTDIVGDGSAASSSRGTSLAYIRAAYANSSSERITSTVNINNYSNSTTNKTALVRWGGAGSFTTAEVGLWRNTNAINSIRIYNQGGGTITAGSTFDLYGISPVAAQVASASGGTDIFYDSTYVYHVFKGSGVFTPYRNLTCDYLVVAGGGGGGPQIGGAGGAGGLRLATSGSFTSGTNYTITVGAGGSGAGAYSSFGKNGNNTSISGSGFSTYSVTGGGGGGYHGATATAGQSGGSGGSPGGGNSGSVAAGSGNAGSYSPVEGYAGGTSLQNGTYYTGGGGGAGGVGENASAGVAGVGGVGASVYNSIDFSSWLTATSTGSGGKLAGGGGGCANSGSVGGLGGAGGGGNGSGPSDAGLTSGVTNTGGGGGASRDGTGAAGGSGIVILRYAR